MNINDLIIRKSAEAQFKLAEENLIDWEDGDHHGETRSIIKEKMEELAIEIKEELLKSINEVIEL